MKKYHFIGVGGIGMSGLARLLLDRNATVFGSDISSSYVTEGLVNAGAKIFIGHSAAHISSDATVIYSSGIQKDNPEYRAAVEQGLPLLHRSDLLHQLTQGSKSLAVAGTHGKTTTSSLLAATLTIAGMDPSYAVGGMISQFKTNAAQGSGEFFVLEADESDGTFLKYHPYGAIITNIDFDHMDHFGSEEALISSFRTFGLQTNSSRQLFWCGDDPRLAGLELPGVSYGFSERCTLRAVNYHQAGWKIVFDAVWNGKKYPQIEVSLIGKHNALNALAVFGLSLTIGAREEKIREALASFGGAKRRCEEKGQAQGILFLDDYAHHPTEIATTLQGIRSAIAERRLIALFQPHRYSRTKDCLGTYGRVFDAADELVVTDIYAAGESALPGVTAACVLKEIQAASPLSCRYIPRNELVSFLAQELKPQDVLVTLGAGDVTKVGPEILALKA